ncbi:hypothetical protein R3P38DRAFT_3280934 [Favolaschia claudopus]|uniref:Uncharacterized protein n=1 Tax=Favolaschia claudopus TaxID=2862362 RepID=A0AAW0AGT9_9AGAR
MASSTAGITTRYAAADLALIDSLSGRDVIQFRDYMFSPADIRSNPQKFHGRSWINITHLREWIASRIDSSPTAPVKSEPTTSDVIIKAEPTSSELASLSHSDPVRVKVHQEGGHDVLEILSDSEPDEPEPDSDIEVLRSLITSSSRSSSIPPTSDFDSGEVNVSDSDDNDPLDLQKSDTIWQDSGIYSLFIEGTFKITTRTTVNRIEYIMPPGIIPSIWPNPRVPTAFVLDLGDSYNIIDPKTGKLYTMDALIKNHDNDSWKSDGSGAADGDPKVVFRPGEPGVPSRRARMTCKGAHACERIDPALIQVARFDLDPATRDAVFAAQQDTRRREGTTVEDIVATYYSLLHNKSCTAVDSSGNLCRGKPKLMPIANGTVNGKRYWVACDGWRKDFKENHRTFSIPGDVPERLLIKLFNGERIADDASKDTPPCTKIVPPRTGLKAKICKHPHIVDGHVITDNRIRKYTCLASRTIFVPQDLDVRKAIVVHKAGIPHSHPMPPLVKVSMKVKETYGNWITKDGIVGTTVKSVDNANADDVILTPALGDMRVKRNMVRDAKAKKYPAGLGIQGALQLFLEDQQKHLNERYIHSFRTTEGGGVIIITGVPYLIKLLDDPGVRAFDDDTTFKRVEGEMNEWELALFFKAVERAVTAIRAYINRSSADFYEILFDELQQVKKLITGKVFGMKRFVKGGNLLVMNADMEAAQVLGIARSIMKTNDPEYSGIPNNISASEAATYFIKICYRHTKEAIHDFKSLVTPEQYNRLMEFMYIDSEEKLAKFSQFVNDLGIKKIQDWWRHKEINDWIVPCLVKSLSNILPEDWDTTPATTNTGETQHHWTNAMTGIKLTLVEAIESARKLDEKTARDVEAAMKNGILTNSHNEAYHRLSRNTQRQSKAAQKVRQNNELTQFSKAIEEELATVKQGRLEFSSREKELKQQLKDAKAATKGNNTTKKQPARSNASRSVVVSSSSTGRVRSVTVPVPQIPEPSHDDGSSSIEDAPAPDGIYSIDSNDTMLESANTITPLNTSPTTFSSFDYEQELNRIAHLSASFGLPTSLPAAFLPNYTSAVDGDGLWPISQSGNLNLPAFTGSEPTTLDELLNSDLFGATITDYPMSDFVSLFGNDAVSQPSSSIPQPSSSIDHPLPPPRNPRKRRNEVDESNIITSSRVRNKSARLRDSEDA